MIGIDKQVFGEQIVTLTNLEAQEGLQTKEASELLIQNQLVGMEPVAVEVQVHKSVETNIVAKVAFIE